MTGPFSCLLDLAYLHEMKRPRGGGNHAEPRSRHNPSSHHHHLSTLLSLYTRPRRCQTPLMITDIISNLNFIPPGAPSIPPLTSSSVSAYSRWIACQL